VVDDHRRVLSVGYNGFPHGVHDSPDRLGDRPTKYELVVHCDLNSIYSAARNGIALLGSTMYLTGAPCHECMKGIAQVGIRRVVFPEDDPFAVGERRERWFHSAVEVGERIIAAESGVEFLRIPNPGQHG
jgi:deoxycytidylate deaminase